MVRKQSLRTIFCVIDYLSEYKFYRKILFVGNFARYVVDDTLFGFLTYAVNLYNVARHNLGIVVYKKFF